MAFFKGNFKPANPSKYMGNAKNIIYRSGWEFSYMRMLDHDPNVKCWASEEIAIPYLSPKDMKIHRYFPDFFYETIDGQKYMIEVKPRHQCVPPKATKGKSKKKLIMETLTFGVNQAKWKSAREFCRRNNIQFKIVTEKELGIK